MSSNAKVAEKAVADRLLVGFVGGGGRWLIETSKVTGADYWQGRWEVGDRSRADQKIWRVTYGCLASNQRPIGEENANLVELKTQLQDLLKQTATFAHEHKLDHFAKAFELGLACLTSEEPYSNVYHKDIAPSHLLPLAGAQLLSAVQAAWVFGGMGSWNDIGFGGVDQEKYERLSQELYALLIQAIVAATNSSVPPT